MKKRLGLVLGDAQITFFESNAFVFLIQFYVIVNGFLSVLRLSCRKSCIKFLFRGKKSRTSKKMKFG